jgi:hypothetical protein
VCKYTPFSQLASAQRDAHEGNSYFHKLRNYDAFEKTGVNWYKIVPQMKMARAPALNNYCL